jgi:hypothetical protein
LNHIDGGTINPQSPGAVPLKDEGVQRMVRDGAPDSTLPMRLLTMKLQFCD